MKQRTPAATQALADVGYVPPGWRKCCRNCSASVAELNGRVTCKRFETRLLVSKYGICRFYTQEKDFEPFTVQRTRGSNGRFVQELAPVEGG